MRLFVCVCLAALLAGCASTSTYSPPAPGAVAPNSKVIERSRASVWDASVPELAKTFFVINNMDRTSGFINLSYSGKPDGYLDCGRVLVTDQQRGRLAEYEASQAFVQYEMTGQIGEPVAVRRSMLLAGRINLVLEELAPERTRVTVTARYEVTRRIVQTVPSGRSVERTESASLSTGTSGLLMSAPGQPNVECRATGQLEQDLLALVR